MFPADDEYGPSVFRKRLKRLQNNRLIEFARFHVADNPRFRLSSFVPHHAERRICYYDIGSLPWIERGRIVFRDREAKRP